jgi:hypothetical protein
MRIGAAIPSGQIDAETPMASIVGPAFTNDFLLDIRVGDRFVFAPYVGYLMGVTGSELNCSSSSSDCRTFGAQLGGTLRYTFARTQSVDAWFGYAFGRQWLGFQQDGVSLKLAGNDHHASVGVDLFTNKKNDSRMGVYVDFAVGKYDAASLTVSGYGSATVVDHGVHQWTTLGAQFVF